MKVSTSLFTIMFTLLLLLSFQKLSVAKSDFNTLESINCSFNTGATLTSKGLNSENKLIVDFIFLGLKKSYTAEFLHVGKDNSLRSVIALRPNDFTPPLTLTLNLDSSLTQTMQSVDVGELTNGVIFYPILKCDLVIN